jgi:hypothetical protein
MRVIAARTWPVDSVLARFEADVRNHVVNSLGSDIVSSILHLPASYAARKDSLLDGLEHLALSSREDVVRRMAVGYIGFAGKGGATWSRVPGVMNRLARIYRTQGDVGVRLAVRNQLPLQAERAAAISFLRALAREPDDANDGTGPHGYFSFGDPRTEALARLAEMGEDGRTVLQAMYRSGEVRSPQGRIMLEDMARRGFPVHDARPRTP